MRTNTRFPVAVHILALLALNRQGENTSEMLAKSINTNPVVVRRINAMLKRAGLVSVRAGVGGTQLNAVPEDITLLDVYNAVKAAPDDALFGLHPEPNPLCPVGANIHGALGAPLAEAQAAMEASLARHTLAEVAQGIAQKTGFGVA